MGYDALHSVGRSGRGTRGCVGRASPSRAWRPRVPPTADNCTSGGSDADHHNCSNYPLHESPFVAMTLGLLYLGRTDAKRDTRQGDRPFRMNRELREAALAWASVPE